MPAKQTHLYQGRDWLTYRWTIAEAFDAVDRMHDLCISQEWADAEVLADIDSSILSLLVDFSGDLYGYVLTACADTIPASALFGSVQLRLQHAEILWWLSLLADQVFAMTEDQPPHLEEIVLTLGEIKRLLGTIDT